MRAEDLKKFVSDSLKKAMRGTVGEPVENAADRMTEALSGLKVGEDNILEGMTFEVHEEPDDVKLIREVMEEPLETLHATVTVRLPADLKRVWRFRMGRGRGHRKMRKRRLLEMLLPEISPTLVTVSADDLALRDLGHDGGDRLLEHP